MNSTPQFKHTPDGALWFWFGGLPAGAYQAQDSHKPYLHPLNTPKGFKLSLDRPHDHAHHKALMLAFQTATHNYWEEYPLPGGGKVGLQRPHGQPELDVAADGLTCRQILHWGGEGDPAPQMVEERLIRCSLDGGAGAFVWQWCSRITPQVDVQLVKSPFSPQIADGTKVNYHGLGIRLRREFGCTGGNEVTVGDAVLPIAQALGRRTGSVTFTGSIDEIRPVPRCSVTFSSPEPYGIFVMDSPFAYLAYGPSVLETPLWRADEAVTLDFTIRVADVTLQS